MAPLLPAFLAGLGIVAFVSQAPSAEIIAAGTPSAKPPSAETTRAETAPAAPEAGGPRRWELAGDAPLHRAASPEAPVLETLATGTVLHNLGCAKAAGPAWCQVQPLRSRTRGYVLAARLRPARAPDGSVPTGADDSPARARARDFDATGAVPCAQIRGQPLQTCTVGIARGTGGDATAIVTFPNGFKRVLSFAHASFIRGDATMSGVGYDTDWRLEDGIHVIRVDDQRYRIPDSLLFGR
ncbi:MAG: hypothetical protein AAF074_17120 [Pseudomonadota bacterium]